MKHFGNSILSSELLRIYLGILRNCDIRVLFASIRVLFASMNVLS